MVKDNLIKKELAIAIILLFIGLAVAPSINADVEDVFNDSEFDEISNHILPPKKPCIYQGGFAIAFIRGKISGYNETYDYLEIVPINVTVGGLFFIDKWYTELRFRRYHLPFDWGEDWLIWTTFFVGFITDNYVFGIGAAGLIWGIKGGVNYP